MDLLSVRDLSGASAACWPSTAQLRGREGEVLSLIGPNGAANECFNANTGYSAPAAGEIVFENSRLNGRKA